MALNSWEFAALALLAVLTVPVLSGPLRTGVFLAINLAFVWSYWGPAAMPVGLGFCLAGYAAARLVAGRSTGWLVACLVVLTAAFVYLRGYTLGGSAAPAAPTPVGIVAIVGLSFLFFKMVHVVVDVAGGAIAAPRLGPYLNYCLNFTTLLMGPIQRYQDFDAQWTGRSTEVAPTFEAHLDAANRVLRGLVKAFVLAPLVAPYILRPGLPIETLGGGDLLLRIYAFYVYLYLDFSGYCDIVIGIGSLMGVRPPENFRFPFLARNVSEYWLRVHRSLTQWLTDYIFTPAYRAALGARTLGQYGFLALAGSLVLTMLVAGAWHGTTVNFVLFGLVHGIALVVVRGYEQVMVRSVGRTRFRRLAESPYLTAAAVLLTYNFTSLAYVFFVLDVGESGRVFARLAALATGSTT
jgi:D-alanyl-lipoteichoic acid acyltransferase DltB (MBOAT superfamily)